MNDLSPLAQALLELQRMRLLVGEVQRGLILGAHQANMDRRNGWPILQEAVLEATLSLGKVSDVYVIPGLYEQEGLS